MDDQSPEDGDVRQQGPMFVHWLVAHAPLDAEDQVRRNTPLWHAIFDMRAAALRLDDKGDAPHDIWCMNEPDRAFSDLRKGLWLYGVALPERMFEAVWALYLEYLEAHNPFCHPTHPPAEWAERLSHPGDFYGHLHDLQRKAHEHSLPIYPDSACWSVTEAAASFSLERYGDDDADARDDLLPGFVNWLDDDAPLILSRGDARPGSPLWNAICDLRAAMIRDHDLGGDCRTDDWTHEPGIRHRAPETLASFGLYLPPALFQQVWDLYRDSPPARRRDSRWAETHLRIAAIDSHTHGAHEVSNRRYGTDPTPP